MGDKMENLGSGSVAGRASDLANATAACYDRVSERVRALGRVLDRVQTLTFAGLPGVTAAREEVVLRAYALAVALDTASDILADLESALARLRAAQ